MAFLLYNQDKWWYKAITWFLVLALIVMISIGVAPRASAVGVLTVTVMAAILAVMAGAGIYTVVSGMAAGDMQSWLQGKLNQWDSYRNDGNVFTDLIEENLITTTVKGFLSIGSAAARGISNFISWLKSDLALVDNSYVTVTNEATLFGGVPVNHYDSFTLRTTIVNDTGRYQRVYYNFNDVYVFRDEDGTMANYTAVKVMKLGNRITGHVDTIDNNVVTNSSLIDNSSSGTYASYIIGSVYIPWNQNALSSIPVHRNINDPSQQAVEDNGIVPANSLSIGTGVINIPDVTEDKEIHIDVGAYPGITTGNLIDTIVDAVLDNILTAQMVISTEFVDAIEAVIINPDPIQVNTDHHAFGFVPPEISFDFSSIWHYVEDAIEYSLSWISWFMGMLTAVPVLAIPLFCCFTLVVVLGAFRRFLL